MNGQSPEYHKNLPYKNAAESFQSNSYGSISGTDHVMNDDYSAGSVMDTGFDKHETFFLNSPY